MRVKNSLRRHGLWSHRDFRRLWAGESVSQVGTAVSQLALPLVAVLVLGATTFQVGLLTAIETASFLIVGLPVGAWVDRMRLRRVLIVNDLVRAVALSSIPLAYLRGTLTIGQLYAVALVVGLSTVFFDVAYQSYLPELVGLDSLTEGNAKLQASESLSAIVGPSLGGVLVQTLTAPYAVLIDALTFLWSAGWVAAIRMPTPKPPRRPNRNLIREMKEGLRFVLGHRLLRAVAACTGTANFFSAMSASVIFVLLARQLQLSAGIIGVLTSTAAIGGLIGSVVAVRITARLGQGPAIWKSALVLGPPAAVLPFVHRDWTLGLYAATQVVMWASVVVYNIAQVSFRQRLCPPDLLGRMNATMRFLVWGTQPLGAVAGGILGSVVGVRPTLAIVAVGSCCAFLPVYFSPLRQLRELPRQAQATEPGPMPGGSVPGSAGPSSPM